MLPQLLLRVLLNIIAAAVLFLYVAIDTLSVGCNSLIITAKAVQVWRDTQNRQERTNSRMPQGTQRQNLQALVRRNQMLHQALTEMRNMYRQMRASMNFPQDSQPFRHHPSCPNYQPWPTSLPRSPVTPPPGRSRSATGTPTSMSSSLRTTCSRRGRNRRSRSLPPAPPGRLLIPTVIPTDNSVPLNLGVPPFIQSRPQFQMMNMFGQTGTNHRTLPPPDRESRNRMNRNQRTHLVHFLPTTSYNTQSSSHRGPTHLQHGFISQGTISSQPSPSSFPPTYQEAVAENDSDKEQVSRPLPPQTPGPSHHSLPSIPPRPPLRPIITISPTPSPSSPTCPPLLTSPVLLSDQVHHHFSSSPPPLEAIQQPLRPLKRPRPSQESRSPSPNLSQQSAEQPETTLTRPPVNHRPTRPTNLPLTRPTRPRAPLGPRTPPTPMQQTPQEQEVPGGYSDLLPGDRPHLFSVNPPSLPPRRRRLQDSNTNESGDI